jgi:hypothetical protein
VQDCSKWSVEVEQAVPSVVLGARDEHDEDLTLVRVSIDGAERLDHLDGTAIVVDPGQHVFGFERSGAPPVEVRALIREGEKDRLLTARWKPAASDPSSAPARRESAAVGTSAPVAGYALLGAGAVLGGVAIFALVTGLNAKAELRAGCARTPDGCSEADIRDVQTRLWLGDVAAPLALASMGIGSWLIWHDRSAPSAPTKVSWGWRPGGGIVSLVRAF